MANVFVYLESGKKITLTDADHIATGGEGAVYLKQNLIYKVYLDLPRVKAGNLSAKMDKLSLLKHPSIAAPLDKLFTKTGEFCGIVLPVMQGDPLCKLFTNTWQTANNFGPDQASHLVTKMRDIVQIAHGHNALIVDGNELNWMADRNQIAVIDVDSWQIPGFKATAIMPSIKDPFSQEFSTGTDWYSWAIVTFQLWTGIHPFKGTHPDFKASMLTERMRAMVSVFDPKVSLPKAARPIGNIPPNLKNWYQEIFTTQYRSTPPVPVKGSTSSVTASSMVQTFSGVNLESELIFKGPGSIKGAINGCLIVELNGKYCLWDMTTRKSLSWITSSQVLDILSRRAALLRIDQQWAYVYINVTTNQIELTTQSQPIAFKSPSNAQSLVQMGNRLLCVNSSQVCEITLTEISNKLFLKVSPSWAILPLSTKFFRKLCVQDLLGTPFIGLFWEDGFLTHKASFLTDYSVLDAIATSSKSCVLFALNKKDGLTYKIVSDLSGGEFKLSSLKVVDDLFNAAVLSTGILVEKTEDELIVSKNTAFKVIPLPSNLTLFSFAGESMVGAFTDSYAYRLKVK